MAWSSDSGNYFEEVAAPAAYEVDATCTFGFITTGMVFICDGANGCYLSFDGTNDHARLANGETVTFDKRRAEEVWLRQNGGACTLRVMAW